LTNASSETIGREKLPEMNEIERELFQLACEIKPQWMYGAGLEEYAERIWVPSRENAERAIGKIKELKAKCTQKNVVQRKWLESIQTTLELDEPGQEVGSIVDVFVAHLVKEGFNSERFKILVDQLCESVDASLRKRVGKEYTNPVKMLAQYQILGVRELLNLLDSQFKDHELNEKVTRLRSRVAEYGKRFAVEGFTDGEFSEAMTLLREKGSSLGREKLYQKVLRFGFDYKETPLELERKALKWLDEEMPKFK
jgi:hypothetical protein